MNVSEVAIEKSLHGIERGAARSAVADDAWAHIAVVEDQIFVRDLDSMKLLTWR